MDRYVWEGWTVGAFIRELAPQVEMIMSGQSWREPFRNKQELAKTEKLIHSVDEDAFVVINRVSEVSGRGFSSKKRYLEKEIS